MERTLASVAGWLIAGFVFGSLVEYWVHRAMHSRGLFAQRHVEHHRDGWGQGVLPELRTYLLPGAPLLAPPYLLGLPSGLGWSAGCVGFAVFAAYAHQLQHDSPSACRWMAMPVHYVHHRDQMWHHDFGMTVDWWDRVFGTYRRVPCDELRDSKARALDVGWRGPLRDEPVWRRQPRSL
ncbi:MAG TPA: sterol desaturase family protein [Planctomycetota bacterium]|nr:sterol desaturase family protein [Planctomycetota bacterium]